MSTVKKKIRKKLEIRKMPPSPKDAPIGRGKATSIFETDINSRDDLRYYGKKLTDPINTVEVLLAET